MSGQATGKRQHKPMRFRAYYDQSLLLFDARIGAVGIGSAKQLARQWRRGIQLAVLVAVAAGSQAQRTVVSGFKNVEGMDAELSDGGVSGFTRKIIGIRFVKATRIQPTAHQLAMASQAGMAGLPVLYQALCTNES
jgi:hypothetical protein